MMNGENRMHPGNSSFIMFRQGGVIQFSRLLARLCCLGLLSKVPHPPSASLSRNHGLKIRWAAKGPCQFESGHWAMKSRKGLN